MDPIEWLEVNAPGFSDLNAAERNVLMHFPLLWSFFEAEALNSKASARSIERWLRELDHANKLDANVFAEQLAYVKDRYFRDGQFTDHFRSLHLREHDKPDLVQRILSGKDTDPVTGVVALFIVIYRFRNNYLHGPKWGYQLQDQLDNISAANSAIMNAMDMSRT